MGLNATNYVLQMKGDKSIASGFDHATRTGDNTFSIFFIDGSKVDLTIPLPKDGKDAVDIVGVNDLGNGKFTLLLSDGSETSAVQTIKGDKGDKGDPGENGSNGKSAYELAIDNGFVGTEAEWLESLKVKGDNGVSPTITENADNTDKIYKLDITTADTTFTTPNLKGADGQGGSGSGEENVIESIKVNGVIQAISADKSVDITVPDAYDDTALSQRVTNIESDYLKADDISGKVDKVEGKSLIADSEIERLASVDNYDDTQVKTQIQAVANGLMDSVGYSADYKTIDIIAKNGVKKSVNVAPIISHASITELSDVDTTNKATGKALVYNATTSKHEYADVSGTDEKVKMDASTDAKYLGELLDNITIANENGELKVKKLDGQEVTITEINYLKGLTMNVMDLVNMFSNGGVKIINTPVATYAELLTLDKSSFIEGISYLVYVLADENHDNAKTTYLVDKDSETPTYFGFADSQRDFTTNPIDLATEITGKLGIANMDSDAIKALFTVDDTYKTETAMNNAFSTHGAKALYDELLLAIGGKANDSDLTTHKDDTGIHVSTEDRTKWDSAKTHADSAHAPSNAQENVLETVKVNGTALTPSNKAVNVTVPTTVAELTDSADYAKTADIPTTLPANGGNADTVNNHTVKSDVPTDAKFTDTVYDDTEVQKRISDNGYEEVAGGKNLLNHNIIDSKIKNCSVLFKNDTFYATNKGSFSTFVLSVQTIVGKSYTVTIKDWSDYSYRCIASVSDLSDNSLVSMVITDATLSMTFTAVGTESLINISPNNTPNEMSNTITFKCMLEEGSVATEYEPYFPSNKMLADENAKQNTEAMDLKMLGWTVPSECHVQNTFSGNTFTQRVGRIDLGSLEWNYATNPNRFNADFNSVKFVDTSTPIVAYSTKYDIYSFNTAIKKDKAIGVWGSNSIASFLVVLDSSYTDATTFKNAMKGVYLYYELATPITKTIDGNEAVEELSSNLSQLEFGEIAGGKNLFNGKYIQSVLTSEVDYTNRNLYNEFPSVSDITGLKYLIFGRYFKRGTYTFSYSNNNFLSLNRTAIAGSSCVISSNAIRKSYTWTQDVDGYTYFTIEADESETSTTDILFKGTPDIQIEEGSVATEYEPYFPSNKMLATENEQQNTEAMDLKMLGWTVPSECPIQNYVDSNGVFHQRVDRVDLGSLEWSYETAWNATSGVSTIKNLTVNMYHSVYVPTIISVIDMPTNYVKKADSDTLWINNGSSTEKPSGYLYFELAEEKTIKVDGNEAVTKVNDSLDVIGKCKNLLNPTLQTTTVNDVTCTAIGDGTYTINGTASADAVFELESYKPYTGNEIFRLVGCPSGGSASTYYLGFRPRDAEENRKDIGSGVTFNDLSTSNVYAVAIIVLNGTTVTNLTFKPMLTENLNATYDDFVPYTGDGDTLTHDVAKLNENLGAYDINENATSSYSKSNGFAIEWIKMCKATKGTYKLSYTINGSTGGSSEIALGKSINDKTLYRNIGLISDGIYEQIIDITSDTDIYIMVYTNGSITISNIKFTLQNIANEVGNLKNDLLNFTSGLYIDGDTDWNTMKTSGMYYYNGWSGSSGSNKPTETKSTGMAFVLNSGIRLLQFVVLESGNSYFRSGAVDELGNWITIS